MILPETIPAPSAASITPEELKTLVSIYVVIVGHLAMREAENSRKTTGGVLGNFLRADRRRYKSLPGVVAQRKAETGQAWMGNREVQDAVDCKVYGVFLFSTGQAIRSRLLTNCNAGNFVLSSQVCLPQIQRMSSSPILERHSHLMTRIRQSPR